MFLESRQNFVGRSVDAGDGGSGAPTRVSDLDQAGQRCTSPPSNNHNTESTDLRSEHRSDDAMIGAGYRFVMRGLTGRQWGPQCGVRRSTSLQLTIQRSPRVGPSTQNVQNDD